MNECMNECMHACMHGRTYVRIYTRMYTQGFVDRHQVLEIPVDITQYVARRSHVHTARLRQE